VFSVPFLFESDARLRAAVAPGSPVRGPLDEAIAKTGARVLWWQAYGGTVLLTKGGQPIKSPSDIRGKKVRMISKLSGTWVAANGGTPVNVGGGEQYFAYQRGTVDVGMTGPDTTAAKNLEVGHGRRQRPTSNRGSSTRSSSLSDAERTILTTPRPMPRRSYVSSRRSKDALRRPTEQDELLCAEHDRDAGIPRIRPVGAR
jgi:hypothetical protein